VVIEPRRKAFLHSAGENDDLSLRSLVQKAIAFFNFLDLLFGLKPFARGGKHGHSAGRFAACSLLAKRKPEQPVQLST
jgi:hypothetical protein